MAAVRFPRIEIMDMKDELSEVTKQLEESQVYFSDKVTAMQMRRKQLEMQDCAFKESLIKFEDFLKKNDIKRARAIKQIGEERAIKEKKIVEIASLQDEVMRLRELIDCIAGKLNVYKIYHEFLKTVVEESEEIREVNDVLSRRDTLTAMRNDLEEDDSKNKEKIERERRVLIEFRESKRRQVIEYNNELASMQSKWELVNGVSMTLEQQWQRIQSRAAKKTLELGQIRMCVYNLYQTACRYYKEAAVIDSADTLEQMDVVSTFVTDLNEMFTQIKRAIELDKPTLRYSGRMSTRVSVYNK